MPPVLEKILRYSEKYTKTDMVYVFKNLSFLGGGHLATAFVTLGFAVFIAHFLPKEEYGNYKYILSAVALINSLALTGLGPALVRAVASGYDGTLEKFSKLNFFWSFIPASILTLGSIYYYLNGNSLLAVGFLVGGLFLPFTERASLYSSVLNGKKFFKILSLSSFLRNAVPTIAVAAIAYLTLNPLYMAIGYFLSTSLILNIFYYLTYWKIIEEERKRVDPEALHLAKHTSLINVFALASDQIDNVLIFQFLGGTPLAIYNFAEAIPNVIQGLIKQIGTIATPKFVNQNPKLVKKTIFRKSFVLFLCTLPIVILYWFLAPYIFQILFPNYMDSVFYSRVIIVGTLFNTSIFNSLLDANKAITEKYKISLTSNIIKILSIFGGVYFFGLIGLILSKIISKIMGYAIVVFYTQKFLNTHR